MAYNTSVKPGILATCSADGTVRLYDPVAGTALKGAPALSNLGDWVYAVALSPDGTLVAGGAWNGEVRVWKIADGKEQAAFNASPSR
jgi:WD40 repeat protein